MGEKTITIRITADQHKEIKMAALNKGKSVKDYILWLVAKDLEKK